MGEKTGNGRAGKGKGKEKGGEEKGGDPTFQHLSRSLQETLAVS